jgi:hypothetical protein
LLGVTQLREGVRNVFPLPSLVQKGSHREKTGQPLGDTDFVKQMGEWISRDLLPKKNRA